MKNANKVKNEVTEIEKRRVRLIYLTTFTFLGPVTSIFTFLQFSQKCAKVHILMLFLGQLHLASTLAILLAAIIV